MVVVTIAFTYMSEKNYLSLSKLSLLMSSCPDEEKQVAMEGMHL